MKKSLSNEQIYLDLLRDTMEDGLDRPDRTGMGVRGLFGRQSRFNLKTFPLLTTKKLDLKSISSELLWFIEGSGDERRLAELRYGKPRSELAQKRTIWSDNADAPYWTDKAAFPGDLGRVYGVQWRKWKTPVTRMEQSGTFYDLGPSYSVTDVKTTDQLANLIDGLRRDPFGRRHIISAWNPGEMSEMALPPCHVMAQFYVSQGLLSCMLTQRSNDLFLGSPYNIASYALFTHMIAQVCGYKVGELVYSQGDVHIYHNAMDAVKEQLTRKPKAEPHLYIDPTIKEIDQFTMDSFDIMGYDPHPAIKVKMAV
jgi:thymidylate synthase